MKKLLIIISLLIWSFSFSQYTNYNVKNGLPSNHIYRITQDYRGFIWFLTDKGLVKFNGKTFKTFTTKDGLPTNDIWDIRITPNNRIWYFSKSAKLGYIENDVVYAFESEHKGDILYPIEINQTNNTVFFSDSKSYYTLVNNTWKIIQKNGTEIFHLVKHPNIKSLRIKNDTLHGVNKAPFINFKISKKEVLKSYHRGQLNDSLYYFINPQRTWLINLNTLKTFNYKYPENEKKHLVRYGSTHHVQFSGKHFVSILKNNTIQTFPIPKHLNSHFTFIDRTGNLWIATFSDGVYFLPKAKQKSHYSLIDSKTGSLKKTNHNLITSVYNKGFYQYDDATHQFKPFIKETDFIFSSTYIKELQTTYYFTNKKIIQLKNNKREDHINRNLILNLFFYKDSLYGTDPFGIYKINPKNFAKTEEFYQRGIRDFIKINDTIYLATSNGIKLFNSQITDGPFNFNKPILSLSKTHNNELIMCTDGFGAYISSDLEHVELLDQTDFLIVQSAFIEKNAIWLATNNGVMHYRKKQNSYQLIRKYTMADGLNINQIKSVFVTKDQLITSSNNGISIIPKNGVKTNQFIDIYFDTIQYNEDFISSNGDVFYKPNNRLTVKVENIDFSNSPFSYEYKILPVHENWTQTNSNQLLFNDLKPQKYQLIIKSHNITKTFNFEVKPLWYQLLITKFIVILLLLSLAIILLARNRKIVLTKQSKKLLAQKKLADFELHALRSQMNPHFVFNSLNAIQYYLTKNDVELSEKYLVKFARLIRMFFDFSREKEIPLKKEIKLLKSYLEIEQMRFGHAFNFECIIDEKLTLNKTVIPTMLLQPIVENSVNHGLFHQEGKGLITIYFNYIDTNSFEVIISDDGVGMARSKEIQKQSLKQKQRKTSSSQVIEERIELLNQSHKWLINYSISNLDKGTSVKLIFTKND